MGYWDDDEYECEPDEAELEKQTIEESTKVNKKKDRLVINADLNLFAEGIVEAVTTKIKKQLYDEVLNEMRREIMDGDMKMLIKTSVGSIVKDLIVDYMENEKIHIGGDFWNETPAEELTMMQYAKRCVKETIETSKFRIVTDIKNKSWGNGFDVSTKEFEFNEYIRAHLGIDNEMKAYFDKQIGEIKENVNKDMKKLFDKSTKEMLADQVLAVLMANETYGKIRNQVGQIADRSVN